MKKSKICLVVFSVLFGSRVLANDANLPQNLVDSLKNDNAYTQVISQDDSQTNDVIPSKNENVQSKLNEELQEQFKNEKEQRLQLEKEQEQAKIDEKRCMEFFYKDGEFKVQKDVAVASVINNFVSGMFDFYLDPIAIKDGISKTYSLFVASTPGIEKLNKFFLEKVKKDNTKLSKTVVNGITQVGGSDFTYLADISVYTGIPDDFIEDLSKTKIKPVKKQVKVEFIQSPKLTKKSEKIKNNGIIVPNKNWVLNPFEIWIKDFEIIESKNEEHNLKNSKDLKKDSKK